MPFSRRRFLATAALGVPGLWLRSDASVRHRANAVIKPTRLKPGDLVGLVAPGGAIFEARDVHDVQQTLTDLGLRSTLGAHALNRRGYLAGSDEDRADDLNAMFADPDVNAIIALRGGWGSNRILPLLNFETIRTNPKILLGFSDITSLLLGVFARTGLITFHGPVGISTWSPFTTRVLRQMLFAARPVTVRNPGPRRAPGGRQPGAIDTITPGKAEGWLVGGNLSVLVSLLGTDYLPEWQDHILFLEDTREDVYRVDRMLTQLSLAGVLDQARAVIFGTCTRCEPEDPNRSLSLRQVLVDHLAPRAIPCFYGLLIGHTSDKLTLPIGIRAAVDATSGTVRLLESPVV